MRNLIAWLVATALFGGCAFEPPDSPTTPVRRALEAIVAHDLDRADAMFCRDRRNAVESEVGSLLPGIFGPVEAMPGNDVRRTLNVIELDVSSLTLTEERTATTVAVRIRGNLLERFAPAQVEALFRAYATENGEPVDDALLGETLQNVSRGDVALPLDETIPVVREDGLWRVCPPGPMT